jgi:hypothetical protein
MVSLYVGATTLAGGNVEHEFCHYVFGGLVE